MIAFKAAWLITLSILIIASPAASLKEEGQVPLHDENIEATPATTKDNAMCYCGNGNGASSQEPTEFACGVAGGVLKKVGSTQYVWSLFLALKSHISSGVPWLIFRQCSITSSNGGYPTIEVSMFRGCCVSRAKDEPKLCTNECRPYCDGYFIPPPDRDEGEEA